MNKLNAIHASKTNINQLIKQTLQYSIHYNTRYCVIFVRIQCNVLVICVILTHATCYFPSGIFRSTQESANFSCSSQQGAKPPGSVAWECICSCSHSRLYKRPVIGKVISVKDDSTFNIEYWKGSSWRKKWKPWKQPNRENWTDNLPDGCVLFVDFQLDEENKLMNEI